MAISAALLSAERRARLDAVEGVSLDQDGMFALRGALAGDDDAEVRGNAAERLGLYDAAHARGPAARAARSALLDAVADPSPYVRERAVHALARHLEAADDTEEGARADRARARARLEEMTRVEPIWRVRRVAVRALAAIAGRDALAALSEVLDDPFWRVRYAAIQALVRWPDCAEALAAEEPISARRRAALAFLRSAWSGERALVELEDEPEKVTPDDDALGDEDPAVVAARLARLDDDHVAGAALVPLLASPHDVLRRLAMRRLALRARDAEIADAVALLDEPRRPYVVDAVTKLLARVDVRRVRDAALRDRASSPARLAWALASAARAGEDLDALVPPFLLHADTRVRWAAVRAAGPSVPTAALANMLADPDERVRAASFTALAQRDENEARGAIFAVDASVAPPLVARAAVASLAERADDVSVRALLVRASANGDPSARAGALASLHAAGFLTPDERARAAADPDPWIRAAVLGPDDAHAAQGDVDPTVRRVAFDALVRARRAPAHTIALAARSDDPWIRARAADALSARDDIDAVESLLRMSRDAAPMTRAAAAEALEDRAELVDLCLAIVGREPPTDEELRLAAHGRLATTGSPAAFAALEHDLHTRDLSPGARWTLLGMSVAYPEEVRAGTELHFEPRANVRWVEPRNKPATVERRPFGTTGVTVAPLAISGAFDPPLSALERARDAGVNAFFWEPEHRTLSELVIRAPDRHDLVIIAGSYEADAKTITRDAERALRRLRVDALGAMLLFWVRSPARLSDEAFGALERLKAQGKTKAIGFSTHLRELAASAIAAHAWDVVMCRHSAAHTGLETTLLPVARERGVAVVAFSALVYGRMLAPSASGERFSAADCYRYTLSQPGISLCLSAPRRARELEENLAALRSPALDPELARRLREHGARVRADNRAFMSLVREP